MRRGSQFSRPNSIDPSSYPSEPLFPTQDEPKFKEGQEVLARFYGDNIWYHAVVMGCKAGSCVVDLKFDDGMIHNEVEEHLIQTNIPYGSSDKDLNNNFYDAGIYQRGDYVEVYKASEGAWRRGRIASDKKNGSYDVRMESGQDEVCRGRFMRFHFRSKDPVDVRILGTTLWKTGHIIRQEKNGPYVIQFDDTNQEEKNVDPKRLMPISRHVIRQRSVEFAQKIDEVIQSSQLNALKYSKDGAIESSNAPPTEDHSREKPQVPALNYDARKEEPIANDMKKAWETPRRPVEELTDNDVNRSGNTPGVEADDQVMVNPRRVNRRQLKQQQNKNAENSPDPSRSGEQVQPRPPAQEKKFTSPRVLNDARIYAERNGAGVDGENLNNRLPNQYDLSPPNENYQNPMMYQMPSMPTPYQMVPPSNVPPHADFYAQYQLPPIHSAPFSHQSSFNNQNSNGDPYRTPYPQRMETPPPMTNPPQFLNNVQQLNGSANPQFSRQPSFTAFQVGEKVNILVDERTGQYQLCFVHSLNLDGTINLMTFNGVLMNQVDPRLVQRLPAESSLTMSQSNPYVTPTQPSHSVLTPHSASASHPQNVQIATMAPLSAPPKTYDGVVRAQSNPPSHPSSAGTSRPLVLEKKSHYKNGLQVLVEVEINAYENLTMEGKIVKYHGDGMYSVLLNHEQDERIVDESLIAPVAMSQIPPTFTSTQGESKTAEGKQVQSSQQTAKSELVTPPKIVNPEKFQEKESNEKVSSFASSNPRKSNASNSVRIHEEAIQYERESANKPTVRRRHALSYVGSDDGDVQDEVDADESSKKGDIFEPEFGIVSPSRVFDSPTPITTQLPYSVGMNVYYQAPGQNKSYLGTIDAINAVDQTVSLLLEFGNYVHNIHFNQILPYNLPTQYQPDSLHSTTTSPRAVDPAAAESKHQRDKDDEEIDRHTDLKKQTPKDDPVPPGIRPPPLNDLMIQTPQKPTQGRKSHHYQRKNLATASSSPAAIEALNNNPVPSGDERTLSNDSTPSGALLAVLANSSPQAQTHSQPRESFVSDWRKSSIGVVGTGSYQFIAFFNHHHAPAAGGNWNEMVIYCNYSHKKALKARQFHVHLVLGNLVPSEKDGDSSDALEDMIEYFVIEDHISMKTVASFSEDMIPFPHISEKDYITICWRIRQNSHTSTFLKAITSLKVVVYEKMKASAYGEVPLQTQELPDGLCNFQTLPLTPISSDKRQVIDYITTKGGNASAQLIIHEDIVSQVLLPIWELDKLSTLSDLESRYPLFSTISKEMLHKKQQSTTPRHQQRSHAIEKKITLVNVLLPSHHHPCTLASNLQRLYTRFFQYYHCTLSFHYYQPSSANTALPGAVAKADPTNMRVTMLTNLQTLYQTITQNMKLAMFFVFLPVSVTQTPANQPRSNNVTRRLLSEEELYQSMVNLFQHLISTATQSPTNSARTLSSHQQGNSPVSSSLAPDSIVQDVLSELQFWYMECLNVKSVTPITAGSNPPRIVGLKWKYFHTLLPYFKFVLILLIVQQLILESPATTRSGEKERKGRSRTKSEDSKDYRDDEQVYPTAEYDDEWLFTLWNSYQQRHTYTLAAVVFYFEVLSMMEGFLNSLPTASNSSGGLSSQQQRATLALLEELITSTQFIHNKITSLDAASPSTNGKNRLVQLCWEELLPKFFLQYSTYLMGNKLADLMHHVLSVLWERAKTLPTPSLASEGKKDSVTPTAAGERRTTRRSKHGNIFEALQIYCVALPHRLSTSLTNNVEGEKEKERSGKYSLYYCSKDFHDGVVLPYLQSLKVPIHTHNQSDFFISIREFPFTLPEELSSLVSDGKHDRRRSRSHSTHRHRSRARSQSKTNPSPRHHANSHSGDESSLENTSRSRGSTQTEQQLLLPIKQQNSPESHNIFNNTGGGSGNEYYSLQEQFIEQLIEQLSLLPPGVKPEHHSSPAVQAAKHQLTQITNQFMKQGVYCLEDLLQLPSLLLSQNDGKKTSTTADQMRENLTQLLMKFFDDLEITKFYQLKLIHFLLQHQQNSSST